MELEEVIKNLQEYIDLDRKMRTSPIEEWSDFEKFCELHCRDIEKVLHYIKEESIPRAVVEEEKEGLNYSYKNIEKDYTEEQLDNYDVSEEDYIEMEKREFAISVLQEILTKGEIK